MQHLLLTRFQGALIGANTIYLNPQQIAPNQLLIDTTPILFRGITSLIEGGEFDDREWAQKLVGDITSSDRAILAMLPLMLFFHDDRVKLREILINVSHSWQLDWETCSSAVALGYIISRSLTESLRPLTLVAQLLDETINLHPLVFQELSTIDRLLERSSSLHQVARRLAANSHPIITPTILAIYCFISTPEDFSLATRRAYQIDRSPFTCALTGILSGAHNSAIGIPLNGYMATQERENWQAAAASLLGAWAGVYRDTNGAADLFALSSQPTSAHPLAIAAPQVIQKRS
jgi:hypothetical protein